MKTLVFHINVSDQEKEIIKSLQKDYSVSFRKMYNNMELMEDNGFVGSLKIKSKKQLEYLRIEVLSFYDKNIKNKERILSNISDLEEKNKLGLKQFRHLQYLKKFLNKKVCFGNKRELIKLSKGEGDKNIWIESRLLPLVYYGETLSYGNRFFNLRTIASGNIMFKPERTKHKIKVLFNPKKHHKDLEKLEELIILKRIPVTIKLTSEKLYVTFDESILNNTNIDIKSFYKTINRIKDKETRKKLIANHYREHENRLKEGKLDRYLGIDLNPDGIGYSILDNKLNIIDKGYFDISKIYNSNKRKYETSIIIKELFKLIKHYKCHTIVVEELNLKNTNLGNKVSNRKVNNLWLRDLIKELIIRRCNEEGILRIEINPVYTSFIGNILNNEYDPIAASIEVCRRGIKKYSKSGFYPELDITSFINDKRYDEIKGCLTWKDMYTLFVTSKWSYRRKLNEFNFKGYHLGNEKSKVGILRFG